MASRYKPTAIFIGMHGGHKNWREGFHGIWPQTLKILQKGGAQAKLFVGPMKRRRLRNTKDDETEREEWVENGCDQALSAAGTICLVNDANAVLFSRDTDFEWHEQAWDATGHGERSRSQLLQRQLLFK